MQGIIFVVELTSKTMNNFCNIKIPEKEEMVNHNLLNKLRNGSSKVWYGFMAHQSL